MPKNPEQSQKPMAFTERYRTYQDSIEQALPAFVGLQDDLSGGQAVAAARYSLLAGGKRIRPVLLLATAELLGCSDPGLLPFACAIEMIHTYSLIHDDLPCMDDDDLRRGRPTCHRVYGEAMAVLAGDYLLNQAFEILLSAIEPEQPETLAAVRLIAQAAGGRGMIGGQVLDITSSHKNLIPAELERIHRLKTGALLSAPIEAAALLSGTSAGTRAILTKYGQAIGLAFQIRDDMLDVTASEPELGKTTGKDSRDGKATYVSLFGLEEAQRRLQKATSAAMKQLLKLQTTRDTTFLQDLTQYLLARGN